MARGDYVTDSFGKDGCSKPGTMQAGGGESTEQFAHPRVQFDLSSIPRDAKVYRAVLKVSCDRGRDYSQPIRFAPLLIQGGGLKPEIGKPLALRPPFFQDLDATEIVRAWVADPSKNAGLAAVSAPGWQKDKTALLVSYEGKAANPTPPVKAIEAGFVNGQVFLRFREVEDIVGGEEVILEDFEKRVLAAWAKRNLLYRIYRHAEPITAANIGAAELVDELEEIRPAYNLDAIPQTEHPNPRSRGSRVAPGGNRELDTKLKRFRIPLERQLESGENLAVMTARKDGSFYYAVTAVVNGYEAVKAFTADNSMAKPVAEKVEAVGPLLQEKTVRKGGRGEEVYEAYVCFYEPPYWPTPLRVEMCSGYDPKLLEAKAVPLEITLGTYGGQSPYNLGNRHVPGAIYVSPPVMAAMGQGIHEAIGTLKSYDEGLVQNYAPRQVLALVEWSRKKWPNIDPQRVCVNGQFAMWALRHPEVFAVVTADPYGNFAAGKEMVRWGYMWGPMPGGSKNADGGVNQWEYLNMAAWIRANPTAAMPFFCGKPSSASHVGDMGFLPAPETYKALLDTKRAFAAHFGPSQGFGGPPPTAAFPIKRDQAHPAFTHCSLDDMVGEGDQWGGAAGGTIGSGDPWGRFNGWMRWSFEDIVDEPGKVAFTVWLDEKAPAESCTAELTPRKCQKFTAKPGASFDWTSADEAGKTIETGTAKTDPNGLVTIDKLTVIKAKRRVTIGK